MKALDTGILLAFLRGSPGARAIVRSLAGEEIATTEVNLYELEAIARQDKAPGRERRLAALDRLRRKLTVLPVDEGAVRSGLHHLRGHSAHGAAPLVDMILGALEANGCSEWITTAPAPRRRQSKLKWRVVDLA
ncbi:MAG: type II toxin-antitoxin system VapC family toxin [Thermoplasmata archaeon]|nr:type II toxin-antitoxin system VapC family toxin [Thermoplasmata archaeon]